MRSCFLLLLLGLVGACRSTGPGVSSLRNPDLCRSGASVEVAWPARLYPATVIRDLDQTGMCLVSYTDETRTWTERVAPARVYGVQRGSGQSECREGNSVLIDWAGTHWYPAVVRDPPTDEGQCPVHYVDFAPAWDENVPLERVRAAKQG